MRLAEREDIFEGLSILLISLPQFLSAQTIHITLQFTAKCLHILFLPTTVGQLSASKRFVPVISASTRSIILFTFAV